MGKKFLKYLNEQAKQPSTWRGLIMLAASIGLISSEHADNLGVCADIIATAFAGSGIIGVIAKS